MIQNELVEIAGILTICMVVAGICRNRGWSGAIPLLLTGVIVGLAPIGPSAPRSPEFVLIVILAPLVFGEALGSSIVDMRRVGKPVLMMATALVVFGAFCVGVVAEALVPEFSWPVAFALGAILGPTDAVAVSATAKRAGLPRRMVNILEGESMVNDGTALTLLRVFSATAAAGSLSLAGSGLILVTSVLGGLAAGAVGGLALVWVMRRSRDSIVTNALILIAPFPIYTGAEALHGSGILAVVLAGLIVAHGQANDAGYTGRLQATSLWRVLTFVLQSVAFFIVGIEMPHTLGELNSSETRQLLICAPIVLITLVLSRGIFVYGMTHLRRGWRIGPAWLVTAWAGTRGPISALAAFTVPELTDDGDPIPGRSLMISITFVVVVASLLLAPTIAPLARRLALPRDDDRRLTRRTQLAMARAALDRLEAIEENAERLDHPISPDVLEALRASAELRMDHAAQRVEAGSETAPLHLKQLRQLSLEMARAEQEELLRLRDEQGLPDELMRELQAEIDRRAGALNTLGG